METLITIFVTCGLIIAAVLIFAWLTCRFIPTDRVGIVQKLWSGAGGLKEGAIIALKGEAGYQADILRGGIHFGLWRWQYAIHKIPLITVKQSKIGYVFALGGEQLEPSQTLGEIVDCNNFQDARKFLAHGGQKGRQRAILREGVYAINIALFNVITEDRAFTLECTNAKSLEEWQQQLQLGQRLQPGGHLRQVGLDRHRHRPRRPHAAAGRVDRAGRGHRQGPAQLPQQLPGH